MAQGLPYDSDEGRAQAATLTAIMTGQAYLVSAKTARKLGPFAGYKKDSEGVLRVLQKHRQALESIDPAYVDEGLLTVATDVWG